MSTNSVNTIGVFCSQDFPIILFDNDPCEMARDGLMPLEDAEKIHSLLDELYTGCFDEENEEEEEEIIAEINRIVKSTATKLGIEFPKI